MPLGKRIRDLRKARGMSRAELARAAGYSDAEPLRKVEVGPVVPRGDTLAKIAAALETTVEYLTGDGDSLPPPPAGQALTVEEWIAQLPEGAPLTAVRMAQLAWELAEAEAKKGQ